MIFEVSRTSYSSREKPCSEAKHHQKEITHTHSGREICKGTFDYWTIEINSLEELIEFVEKHGQIVLQKDIFLNNTFEIEIYDTWRE